MNKTLKSSLLLLRKAKVLLILISYSRAISI